MKNNYRKTEVVSKGCGYVEIQKVSGRGEFVYIKCKTFDGKDDERTKKDVTELPFGTEIIGLGYFPVLKKHFFML